MSLPKELYEKIDPECRDLVFALNELQEVATIESCCGHKSHQFMIWFEVSSLFNNSMLLLSRLMCNRYYDYANSGWTIELYHSDTNKQICFLLKGPKGNKGYTDAFYMAKEIMDHIHDRVGSYNILKQGQYREI